MSKKMKSEITEKDMPEGFEVMEADEKRETLMQIQNAEMESIKSDREKLENEIAGAGDDNKQAEKSAKELAAVNEDALALQADHVKQLDGLNETIAKAEKDAAEAAADKARSDAETRRKAIEKESQRLAKAKAGAVDSVKDLKEGAFYRLNPTEKEKTKLVGQFIGSEGKTSTFVNGRSQNFEVNLKDFDVTEISREQASDLQSIGL